MNIFYKKGKVFIKKNSIRKKKVLIALWGIEYGHAVAVSLSWVSAGLRPYLEQDSFGVYKRYGSPMKKYFLSENITCPSLMNICVMGKI